jgi:hypothetical protein
VDYPYSYYTHINNLKLYELDRADLLNTYGDFFVLPFNALKAQKPLASEPALQEASV